MSREPDIGATLTLPVNEYQSEILAKDDQVVYDTVAPDETLRRAPPGGLPAPFRGQPQQQQQPQYQPQPQYQQQQQQQHTDADTFYDAAQPTLTFQESVKSTVVFHNNPPKPEVNDIYDPVQPLDLLPPPPMDTDQQYEPIQQRPHELPVQMQQYEHMQYDPTLAV